MSVRITRRPPLRLNELVFHEAHGRGYIDTMVWMGGGKVAYVTLWDGRGERPRIFSRPRYICPVSELGRSEVVVVRITRRDRI